jgi:hypothetical protein
MKPKNIVISISACVMSIGISQAQAINVTTAGVGIGTSTPQGLLSLAYSYGESDMMNFYSPENNALAIQTLLDNRTLNGYNGYGGNSQNKLILQPLVGNVGIGTITPKARLGVGPSFNNSAFSPVFCTNASTLPSAAGSELVLASIGFNSDNESALGIRARRVSSGSDWTTSAISLSMDVDNTSRAGWGSIWIHANGTIGINTTTVPTHTLTINGQVKAKGYATVTGSWSDHIFSKDYKLPTLNEVEQHIAEKGHLPGIPSEKEALENGVELGDMQVRLLAQIEQLTLHMIAHQKAIEALKQENASLKRELKTAIKSE